MRKLAVLLCLLVLVLGFPVPQAEAAGDGDVEPPILFPIAGPDQTVTEGSTVVFDGTASYVINGTLDAYYWDFDASVDADLDGNFTNDRDATGSVVTHTFGDDGDYVVTLSIGSDVLGTVEGLVAQDTILIIDSSGSMGWNDPSGLRQTAATDYLYLMGENDSAAVVVFSEYPPPGPYPTECSYAAWLVQDQHLTPTDLYGKAIVKDSIDYTRYDDGGTNIEKALQVAHLELLSGYNPTPTELVDCSPPFPDPQGNAGDDHAWIEILLTDGEPTHGLTATDDEVQIAAYIGVRIFTIGLGGGVDEDYLQDIADSTGGMYYFAPTADDLQEIYNNISKVVKTIVGGTIYGSDSLVVHVQNVPPQLELATGQPRGEGSPVNFYVNVTDPGSDDIHLTYAWGDGTGNETYEFLNSPPDPDPYPSPQVNPRDISDTRSHTYGDNWNYGVTVTATDDDGGVSTYSVNASVDNLPPTLSLSVPRSAFEGESVLLQATATDEGSDDLTFEWSYGDGTSDSTVHYNDGVGPDPLPSPGGTYPFTADDVVSHAWGDDGSYDITVRVDDDDGGSATATTRIPVSNLPPEILLPPEGVFDEGELFEPDITATDPGSDDLQITWRFELGPSYHSIHYNDGAGPDPKPSPWGTYPFTVSETRGHTYGDDGLYAVTLSVSDDDGGLTEVSFDVQIRNVAPTVNTDGPYSDLENSGILFHAWASDPGSDDLTFVWRWEDGTSEIAHFYNGHSPDLPRSPWGTHPFAAEHFTSRVYGDNGEFDVTLHVFDDDDGMTTVTPGVVVENVDPVKLNVSYEILYNVPRTQGYWRFQCTEKLPSPDHVGIQQGFIDYISEASRVFNGISTKDEVCAILESVTEEDMRLKALAQLMALWLNLASDKVLIPSEFHIPQLNATMGMMEFMVWIEDTILNRPEDMELAKDLADAINNGQLIPYAIITASVTASDPGSDDIIVTWDWGDGDIDKTVYFNDGIGPDPYPSPEVNPIIVTDTVTHSYASPGSYLLRLTVADDDGGFFTVVIPLSAERSWACDLYWQPSSEGVPVPGPIPDGVPVPIPTPQNLSW